MLDDGAIRELLHSARTVAVVGMSSNPSRDSYAVARFLQRNGYRVIPVNPLLSEPVLGEQPYASLRDVPVHIDIVDVFRRSEHVAGIVDDAIAVGADVVWTQLGVSDTIAARSARQAGVGVVMDRCIAIEHRRLTRVPEGAMV